MNKLIARNEILSASDTLVWWGIQRFFYNVIMALIGFLSFFIGFFNIPMIYIFIAIGLNVLFTTSWILELLFVRPFKSIRFTNLYSLLFIICFYSYSIFSVLFHNRYPELLGWTYAFVW